MSHTYHAAFLPFLSPGHPHPDLASSASSAHLRRAQSFHSGNWSVPSTPYPSAGPAPLSVAVEQPAPPLTSTTVPAPTATRRRWPLSALVSSLAPTSIATRLTTVNLKLHSRIVFNEQGKVIYHEDVVGLKETLEGLVPILGTLYALNRKAIGTVVSTASRLLNASSGARAGSDPESCVRGCCDGYAPANGAAASHPSGAMSAEGLNLHFSNPSHVNGWSQQQQQQQPYPHHAPYPHHHHHHHAHFGPTPVGSSRHLASPVALRKSGGHSLTSEELERRLGGYTASSETTTTTTVDDDN